MESLLGNDLVINEDSCNLTSLSGRVDAVSDRMRGRFRMPLLKVTGGEVFVVRGIMDFLAREAGASG